MSSEVVIRASSLPMYPQCGRRWAARTIRSRIEAAGYRLRTVALHIGAATGSATHAAMAHMLKEKLKTGTLGNETETDQRAMQVLDEEIAEAVMWDTTTPDLNTAQKQVRRQSGSYRRGVATKIVPIAVEERLEAEHPLGVVISGQQDVVISEPATLHDLKTGVRQGANAAQYGTYSRLLRAHDRPVVAIVEDYVKRVAVNRPQPDPVTVPYSLEVAERAAEIIISRIVRDLAEFRETGSSTAFLANPSSYLCSDRFCPAWGTKFCREHAGAR